MWEIGYDFKFVLSHHHLEYKLSLGQRSIGYTYSTSLSSSVKFLLTSLPNYRSLMVWPLVKYELSSCSVSLITKTKMIDFSFTETKANIEKIL